jgi:hypothetical protein
MPSDRHIDPQVLIIRLWAEPLGDGEFEWRGKAQHIPSGETCYFRDWPALLAFLHTVLPPLL